MPGVPNVGVFYTAFHQTMPDKAYIYGIPYEYYTDYKIRRYGFHGTSHSFVSKRTAELLGKNIEYTKIVLISSIFFPVLFARNSIMAGSISQDLVPMITPASGVRPMVVSTDLPPLTAVILEPLPIQRQEKRNIQRIFLCRIIMQQSAMY